MEDWKSKLAALKSDLPEPQQEETVAEEPRETAATVNRKETLHVVMEKKGRGGKTATIIEGFQCDDDSLKGIAKQLQKTIGTGGSARGGEILLQGDCRSKVAQLLRDMGYKVKG